MANPLLKRQEQTVRDRMQKKASGLVNRLIKNADGTLTDVSGVKVEMTSGQIKSAEIILARCVPTLQSSTIEDVTPQRTGEEIREDAKQFLIQAGMEPTEADQALDRMAQEAIH